jgi:TatA/E family protein of Tat protein translocase
MYLLIFEFIGTQEFVLILVAALILFGPRKLPELARSVGKSLSEFKRASEDFKDQWEREVDREASSNTVKEAAPASIAPPAWETPAPSAAEIPPPEAELVPQAATAEPPAAATLVEEMPETPASKGDWL